MTNPESLLILTVGFTVAAGLFYLATQDVIDMEISDSIALGLIALLAVFNITIFLWQGANFQIELGTQNYTTPVLNLAGFIFYTAITGATVLLTKEKGMGAGDIRIAAIIGLSLGIYKTIAAFYLAILFALMYGLIIAAKHKKFRGVKLPFVPFMAAGALIAFAFNLQFFNF